MGVRGVVTESGMLLSTVCDLHVPGCGGFSTYSHEPGLPGARPERETVGQECPRVSTERQSPHEDDGRKQEGGVLEGWWEPWVRGSLPFPRPVVWTLRFEPSVPNRSKKKATKGERQLSLV